MLSLIKTIEYEKNYCSIGDFFLFMPPGGLHENTACTLCKSAVGSISYFRGYIYLPPDSLSYSKGKKN